MQTLVHFELHLGLNAKALHGFDCVDRFLDLLVTVLLMNNRINHSTCKQANKIKLQSSQQKHLT